MLISSPSISAPRADGRCSAGSQSGVLSLDEVCRFPNEPVRQQRIAAAGTSLACGARFAARPRTARRSTRLESIGVDTWGCDYALLDAAGSLLENPYHYRDARTDGVMEAVWQRVSREEIYAITGIQFLVFNTLYQLYAACQSTPERDRVGARRSARSPIC